MAGLIIPKYFNTAGPCSSEWHYMVPPLPRLPDARRLIDRGGYFVVHAPRQSGKTTTLQALAKALTDEGKYTALYFSCEEAEVVGDDYVEAQRTVLGSIEIAADGVLPEELRPPPWPGASNAQLLRAGLQAWAKASPRPLVLFFDEIDALRGESLRSVLRQLRAAYPNRPKLAPWSVVLCGLRDVRDYRAASGGDPARLGTPSPFNIKVASLLVANFALDDVRALLAQHTAATGQLFEEGAVTRIFALSQGQPWLVNTLAAEIVNEMRVTGPIASEHVDEAKERLILARATHLDSLVGKLQEPRVKKVIEPIIAGEIEFDLTYDDDVSYTRDLGLITYTAPPGIANPIYREIIIRVLTSAAQAGVIANPRSFVLPDGRFDMSKMLHEFAAFWRENGEMLAANQPYAEIASQLIMMAYLQRVVNGGGYIDREYGVGRGRIDLLIRWPWSGGLQREVIELKVWRDGRPDPLKRGLGQIDDYLASLELETGTLVLFDRRNERVAMEQRIRFDSTVTASGRAVTLLRV